MNCSKRIIIFIVFCLNLGHLFSQNKKEIILIDIVDVREDQKFASRLFDFLCVQHTTENSLIIPLHYNLRIKNNNDVKGYFGYDWNCDLKSKFLSEWRNDRTEYLTSSNVSMVVDFIFSLPDLSKFLENNNGNVEFILCTNRNPNSDLQYMAILDRLVLINGNDKQGRFIFNVDYSNENESDKYEYNKL